MGILDALKYSTGDPDKDAQLNRGLLMAGLQLMGARGSLFPALSQAGIAGIQAADQTGQMQQARQRQQLQEQMQRLQIGQAQREAKVADLAQQFYRAPSSPAFDATGDMETAVEAPNNASGPGGFNMSGYLSALEGLDPARAFQMRQMMSKDESPIAVAEGTALVNRKTLQPVFTNLKAATPEAPTADWKDYQRAVAQGYKGQFIDYQREMANLKAPKTHLSVGMTQEREESKAVGKFFGEQYADIQKAGMGATGTITRMDQLSSLLNGINTGKLTPVGTEVAAFAQSLGLSLDPNLGNKQAADALVKEMALQLRNPTGGAGMPGAMSDQDRKFLASMAPSLANTPEGNALMISARKKLAQRDQDVARLAREYRMRKGGMDDGFLQELKAFSDANPLFPNQGRAPGGPTVSNW